jgi:hypothetical protein
VLLIHFSLSSRFSAECVPWFYRLAQSLLTGPDQSVCRKPAVTHTPAGDLGFPVSRPSFRVLSLLWISSLAQKRFAVGRSD